MNELSKWNKDEVSDRTLLVQFQNDQAANNIRVLRTKRRGPILRVDQDCPDLALAAEGIMLVDGERVLLLDCGDGLRGLVLGAANPGARMLLHDDNVGNLELARRNVALNAAILPNLCVVNNNWLKRDAAAGEVDVIIFFPDRFSSLKIIAATITVGRRLLAAGGRMYLVTHRRIGGVRHEAMLHGDFTDVNAIARGHGGYRLLEARGGGAGPLATSNLRSVIVFDILGRRFELESEPSLFAKDGLDDGTRLLLESVDLSAFGRLLDIGCGWGAVGLVAATVNEHGRVVMVDVDTRAVDVAADNAVRLGLRQRAAIVASDNLGTIPGDFDLALSNPPFHADGATLLRLFRLARQKLRPRCELYLVVEQTYVTRFRLIVESAFGNVRFHTPSDGAFVVLAAHA